MHFYYWKKQKHSKLTYWSNKHFLTLTLNRPFFTERKYQKAQRRGGESEASAEGAGGI